MRYTAPIVICLLLTAACSKKPRRTPLPSPPTIAAIDVRPRQLEVVAGDTVQFCAFVRMSDGRKLMTTQAEPIPRCQELFNLYLLEQAL